MKNLLFNEKLWACISLICLCFVLISLFSLKANYPLQVDEINYFPVLRSISYGNYFPTTLHLISVLPGYYWLIGSFAHFLQFHSLSEFRLLALLTSFFTLVIGGYAFYNTFSKYWFIRFLQFAFFPLIFPLYFVIYSDVFSLGVLLTMYVLIQKKHYFLAGVVAMVGLLVRQDIIFWFIYFVFLIYTKNKSVSARKVDKPFLKRILFFIVGVLGFLAFVIYHHGAAYGYQDAHPLSFHLGNIYLFLIISAVIFIPPHITFFSTMILWIRRHVILSFCLLLFSISFIFFTPDHPGNSPMYNLFLRNDFFYVSFYKYCL